VVDCNVDLLVSADVGSDCSDPNVPGEPEEGQEDEEDGAFKDGSLKDGVVGVINPGVADIEARDLVLGVGAVGVDHELQGLIVALFVGHVGLQGLHHTISGWKVPGESSLEKVTDRKLKMPKSQATLKGLTSALFDEPSGNLGGGPGALAG
jgi:hypothetical protein